MRREERNALSKQKILEAALCEFGNNGYEKASLNTVCSAYDISKGNIYHYFKDKDEIYLSCVKSCFDALNNVLEGYSVNENQTILENIRDYFDVRFSFFMEHPSCLGIFVDTMNPPFHLKERILSVRKSFDDLNLKILRTLLKEVKLRKEFTIDMIAEDFRMYMDTFNMHFKNELNSVMSMESLIQRHEERCYRQLDILLYGIVGEKNEE